MGQHNLRALATYQRQFADIIEIQVDWMSRIVLPFLYCTAEGHANEHI